MAPPLSSWLRRRFFRPDPLELMLIEAWGRRSDGTWTHVVNSSTVFVRETEGFSIYPYSMEGSFELRAMKETRIHVAEGVLSENRGVYLIDRSAPHLVLVDRARPPGYYDLDASLLRVFVDETDSVYAEFAIVRNLPDLNASKHLGYRYHRRERMLERIDPVHSPGLLPWGKEA